MTRKTNNVEMAVCPVGKFFMDMERILGRKSKFVDHMTRSRIEALKAIRSLVDEIIEDLDKKKSKGDKKKSTKIKVE